MSTPREQVLEMVASGKVSPEEGDALLRSMERGRRHWSEWLWNPAARVSTGVGISAAAVLVAVGIALAPLNVRFDGALDMHVGAGPVPLSLALLDALCWPITACLFWAVGRVFGRASRVVDHLVAVGLARAPQLPAAVASAVVLRGRVPDDPAQAMAMATDPAALLPILALSLVLIPVLVWQFVLLVTGLRAASGLRGPRLAGAAVVAIVAAEVVTKIFLGVVT